MEQWNPDAYDAWYETPLGAVSGRLEKELILSMAGVKKGEKALDAGCGTGIYSIELARRRAITTGIDSSGEMLDWAGAKARKEGLTVEFVSTDALSLPFFDDYFDIVLSVDLLCFVKEREKALLEMRRVLRPGGRLIVGVLNKCLRVELPEDFPGACHFHSPFIGGSSPESGAPVSVQGASGGITVTHQV